jgi:hypothetical protein
VKNKFQDQNIKYQNYRDYKKGKWKVWGLDRTFSPIY